MEIIGAGHGIRTRDIKLGNLDETHDPSRKQGSETRDEVTETPSGERPETVLVGDLVGDQLGLFEAFSTGPVGVRWGMDGPAEVTTGSTIATAATSPRGGVMAVELKLQTVSEANRASHEHWARRHRRAKEQRQAAHAAVVAALRRRSARMVVRDGCLGLADLPAGVVVLITRVAPRALDSDNATGSCKHVRDGIADALGIDDRDPRVEWKYAQARGGTREYAVSVLITGALP